MPQLCYTAGMDDDAITFDASVAQVKTLADGGIRLVLDLPEDAIGAAAWLMHAKRNEECVTVVCSLAPTLLGEALAQARAYGDTHNTHGDDSQA